MFALMFAAAAPTAADRLRQIPAQFWLKLAVGVLVILVAAYVWRKVAGANRLVTAMIAAFVLSFIGLNWVYQREEPAWATPVVSKLAEFLPTKGKTEPKKAGL
jgi:hypothetical protein